MPSPLCSPLIAAGQVAGIESVVGETRTCAKNPSKCRADFLQTFCKLSESFPQTFRNLSATRNQMEEACGFVKVPGGGSAKVSGGGSVRDGGNGGPGMPTTAVPTAGEYTLVQLARKEVRTAADACAVIVALPPSERQALQDVVAEVGTHPLVLKMAGAYIYRKNCSFEQYRLLLATNRLESLEDTGVANRSHGRALAEVFEAPAV